ncbi:MAG: MFS transporter [Candidatus Thermoplasmatota archaeon]|nr:MFS transporter [Candidatus Thermoplasmatota archaeon]MCL5794054.1 MFS transporter [Candidatus Thermoplasmatota archaeon]
MGFFDKVDQSRLTGRLALLIVLAAMGLFIDGFDLNEISVANQLVLHGLFSETTLQYALVNISAFIGMAIGGVTLGIVADKRGRNLVFALDLVFFTVFGVLSGLVGNWWELFIFRFLMGIGIGGDYPVSSTILSEFAPKMNRGKILMLMVGFYWVGILVSAGISYALIQAFGLDYWRYLFVISGLIAVPVILFRFEIPETPRWLRSKGRSEEAIMSMDKIGSSESVPSSRKTPEGLLSSMPRNVALSAFFVFTAWFLFDLASYPVGFYLPSVLFQQLGFQSNVTLVQILLELSVFGAIISVGAIIGYIIAIIIVDRIGRRLLTIAGFAAMTILLGIYVVLRLSGGNVVVFYFLFVMMEQWIGAVTLFYPTEIFPTRIRSTMQGTATMVSRIGAILGIFLFPYFSSQYLAFVFALLACLAGLIVSLALAPETTGRTLEESSADAI